MFIKQNKNRIYSINEPPSGSSVTRSPTLTPASAPRASRRAGSGMWASLDSISTRTWLCSRWAKLWENIENCHKIFSSILMLMTRGSLPVSMLTARCLPQQGFLPKLRWLHGYFMFLRYAKSFGSDNSVWIQEFSRVYYKMLMNGYSKLKKVRWFEMWNTRLIIKKTLM